MLKTTYVYNFLMSDVVLHYAESIHYCSLLGSGSKDLGHSE